MGSFSNYLENALINHVNRSASYTMPAALYVALFTSNPDFETGSGGTEATGGGYVRKALTMGAASGGAAASSGVVEWTAGTDLAAATAYTGFAVFDAVSGGNLLWGDTFGSSKTPASGEKIQFAAGALTNSLT